MGLKSVVRIRPPQPIKRQGQVIKTIYHKSPRTDEIIECGVWKIERDIRRHSTIYADCNSDVEETPRDGETAD